MSALALDYAAAPDCRSVPSRPQLVLVPAVVGVAGGGRLRPTRAARLLATGLVALSVASVLTIALSAWSAPPPISHSVTVQPGQTLTGIATRELPQLPLGAAVTRIELANDMATGQVDAGQVLVIPAGD